jgi:hypothetical protein
VERHECNLHNRSEVFNLQKLTARASAWSRM